MSASAPRTEPARVSAPVTTDRTFPAASSSASTITGSSHPAGAATMMPSIQSESSRRRSGSATSRGVPGRANAFGRSSPSRSPRPAAARTAQTLTLCRRAGLRLRLRRGFRGRRRGLLRSVRTVRAVRREHVVEPFGRRVLVEGLRVHQLGREDLLRLHEHLLLPRGEAFLVIAERQVPHDLSELEDIACLHLVAVVLEPAIPVLRHRSAAAGERLRDLLDHLFVDDLPQPDCLGVLARNVDGHVVVQDLDGQVFALLPQDDALFLLYDRACSVVWIHHLVADLEQAFLPYGSRVYSSRRRRRNAPGAVVKSVSKVPQIGYFFVKIPARSGYSCRYLSTRLCSWSRRSPSRMSRARAVPTPWTASRSRCDARTIASRPSISPTTFWMTVGGRRGMFDRTR